MSQEIERYLQAGTRASTRRSYQQALEHFEVTWGGFLPATSDAIVRYLVDHAAMLSSNTLKLRLAALAQWHVSQGCGFHAIRTLSPRTSGHSFHAHSDRQSERSDAGSHC
ncbi:hypothetical protein [Pseudomonas aeruginosa]|uniref:hypothetical protein n=1 Tax=Pseudomonas aeruginosa TaxID=287 RepID=UPI001BD1C521|nr:hypothetical protein [Pseudomonas aeruginosa]